MTHDDYVRHKIDRLANQMQTAIGLLGYLERTHVVQLEDLKKITAALKVGTVTLAELRDGGKGGQR